MEALPIGPFDAKILLDESCSVAIDGFSQVHGFARALPAGLQPPNFRVKRSVNKNVKGIATALQILGRAASHNYALAAIGRFFHNTLRNLANALGIRHLQPRSIQTAFEAAAHERFEEAVEQWIPFLFAVFNNAVV